MLISATSDLIASHDPAAYKRDQRSTSTTRVELDDPNNDSMSDGDALCSSDNYSDNDESTRIAAAVQATQFIRANMIGCDALFHTPFGTRAQCYADFTASGKPLYCVEDFVQTHVLPLYGNTHSSTSATALQMTAFREDARRMIARAVNADIASPQPRDCVLFTGQGTTSAINRLVAMLDLHRLGARKSARKRPVVFVGPFEHHSNLLPWRESGATVVMVPEDSSGRVCIATLSRQLQKYARRPLKIGTFSAASNLTGVLSDVDAIATVLHQHGGLAFFDYATCAPYVKIDMNPGDNDADPTRSSRLQLAYKDGIFASGHKFIGGPGASGLLVVKATIAASRVSPTVPGGGTVLFVTERDHRYLSDATEREEGGTPDILGDIRLGLAFQVKERVGDQVIMELERRHERRVLVSLASNDRIVLLGRHDVEKLPIFSFLVRFGDRFLHYNFVCALLNDLFGIQTRGGCQCAGPYAAQLLGVARRDLSAIKTALVERQGVLKPGFSRMSFPYFMDDAQVDYILRAVHFVANDGWRFLSQYRVDIESGAWTHVRSHSTRSAMLHRLEAFADEIDSTNGSTRGCSTGNVNEASQLDIARHCEANVVMAKQLAIQTSQPSAENDAQQPQLHALYEPLRWFVYPNAAAATTECGKSSLQLLSQSVYGPCQPHRYTLTTTRQDVTRSTSIRTTSSSSKRSSAITSLAKRVFGQRRDTHDY